MQEAGLSAGTAHYVHRTARAALNEAVRRGHLVRNPAVLAKAPSPSEEEVQPYEVPEVRRLLEAAAPRRNSARWAIALAVGLRQGEALGLKWGDIDLDKGTLRIRRSLLRAKYEHGCGGECGRSAGRCPSRRNTRPVTGDVKSKAGRRTVGLPVPLVALLRKHRAEQNAERTLARQLWRDEGWVFATPTGGPLNHYTDQREWKQLLQAAGLREARLHDARHTAATVLLILGQPERTVMSLMGWSTTDMAKRYQHVTDTIRATAAAQVGDLIWDTQTQGASELVTVSRDALVLLLQVVEAGLLNLDMDPDLAQFQAALTNLHTAMATPDNDANGEAK
jgi:integrase